MTWRVLPCSLSCHHYCKMPIKWVLRCSLASCHMSCTCVCQGLSCPQCVVGKFFHLLPKRIKAIILWTTFKIPDLHYNPLLFILHLNILFIIRYNLLGNTASIHIKINSWRQLSVVENVSLCLLSHYNVSSYKVKWANNF